MNMLPKAIRKTIPMLYSTESIPLEDKVVRVKYFSPYTGWTWYAVEAASVRQEGDEESFEVALGTPLESGFTETDVLFFGFVIGFEREWGLFSLSELSAQRGPAGVPMVERDMHFEPAPLKEVLRREGRGEKAS